MIHGVAEKFPHCLSRGVDHCSILLTSNFFSEGWVGGQYLLALVGASGVRKRQILRPVNNSRHNFCL